MHVAGRDLRHEGKAARNLIGYVPQEPRFPADLTVRDCLGFYARLRNTPAARIDELLADMSLIEHAHKRVAALSGGMRKRLALAAALLSDPPLLILDEITANLDAGARQAFMALLARQKLRGTTLLFTSHRLEEVVTLADRVLVLEHGRLKTECPPQELARLLGLSTEIKLFLPESQMAFALEILQSGGFFAHRNGQGIYVQVASDRKTAPIHLLAENRIRIENFDLENQDAESSHA
jgi:ABC-type multidrug transport system ATPase subunit